MLHNVMRYYTARIQCDFGTSHLSSLLLPRPLSLGAGSLLPIQVSGSSSKLAKDSAFHHFTLLLCADTANMTTLLRPAPLVRVCVCVCVCVMCVCVCVCVCVVHVCIMSVCMRVFVNSTVERSVRCVSLSI